MQGCLHATEKPKSEDGQPTWLPRTGFMTTLRCRGGSIDRHGYRPPMGANRGKVTCCGLFQKASGVRPRKPCLPQIIVRQVLVKRLMSHALLAIYCRHGFQQPCQKRLQHLHPFISKRHKHCTIQLGFFVLNRAMRPEEPGLQLSTLGRKAPFLLGHVCV